MSREQRFFALCVVASICLLQGCVDYLRIDGSRCPCPSASGYACCDGKCLETCPEKPISEENGVSNYVSLKGKPLRVVSSRTLKSLAGVSDSNDRVVAGEYTGGALQHWRITQTTDGRFRLRNIASNRCLCVQSNALAVSRCSCDDAQAAQWRITTTQEESERRAALYELRHSVRETCLDSTSLHALECSSEDQQRWHMEATTIELDATANKPVELRTLLIVKKSSEVPGGSSSATTASLPDENIAAAVRSIKERTSTWMNDMSGGRLVWKVEARVSQVPLRLDKLRKHSSTGLYYPTPQNMAAEDLDFLPGEYDSIIVYWRDTDTYQGLPAAGYGPRRFPAKTDWETTTRGAGWGFIPYQQTATWDVSVTESDFGWLHILLVQLDDFYQSLHLELPANGKNSAAEHGYEQNVVGGVHNWKHWYRDYLLRRVITRAGRFAGLGDRAWHMGYPRTWATADQESFLTEVMRSRNLLANSSFEDSRLEQTWTKYYWAHWRSIHRLAAEGYHGQQSLCIQNGKAGATGEELYNHAAFEQEIQVKPNTHYLLSGYIRTNDVTVESDGMASGANFHTSLNDTEDLYFKIRPRTALHGTNPWTYVADVVYTGAATELEIRAANGYFSGTATGEACFDHVLFTEIDFSALR